MRDKLFENFQRSSGQGFNLVPILKNYVGDLETPLSVYLKLVHKPNGYLLESVVGGERFGRFSFIGLPAKIKIEVKGREVALKNVNGEIIESNKGDPLKYIENYVSAFKVAPIESSLPRFCGGLAGYFGYDTVKLFKALEGSAAHQTDFEVSRDFSPKMGYKKL